MNGKINNDVRERNVIESFYIDQEKKTVHSDLFDGKAQEIAKNIIGVTTNQLRRIYDEVKSIEPKLNSIAFEELEPYIRMIKVKARYNIARVKNKRNEKAYKYLTSFINEGIGEVKNKKDFYVFLSLFEAVYGFYFEFEKNSIKEER